jgi:UDP-N-acetylmuramoylalanine--D-glutamate ligase
LKANVAVFDNKDISTLDKNVLDKIYEYNIPFSFGENYLSKLIDFDLIFRSPSCRPDLPELLKEAQRGAIITTEIEMLLELCPAKTIGITGSDGKTTTSTLIYEILKQKGYECYLGGNIGTPLFTKIEEMRPDDIVVLELSSFQLMGINVSPNIAVITNVTPNHLDIHKSYDEYIQAKSNIFKYQKENDVVILNYDNDITKNFAKITPGKTIFFSSKTKLTDGIILDEGIIKLCDNNLRRHVINTKNMKLRGIHNSENACAAIAATSSLVDIVDQVQVLTDFLGVEHRLEYVKEINEVKWYNDSIGTSPTRTIAGLYSFDETIVLIAGGYDKHLDYEPLAKPILEKASKLILMGQTAKKINTVVTEELKQSDKKLEIYNVNTLEEAVKKAKEIAAKGEIVLFSPASASFDMFKSFAERGEKFKELVNKL